MSADPPPTLVVRTVPVHDSLPLSDALSGDVTGAWTHGDDGLVGLGAALILPLRDGLDEASHIWRRVVATATVDDQVHVEGSGLVGVRVDGVRRRRWPARRAGTHPRATRRGVVRDDDRQRGRTGRGVSDRTGRGGRGRRRGHGHGVEGTRRRGVAADPYRGAGQGRPRARASSRPRRTRSTCGGWRFGWRRRTPTVGPTSWDRWWARRPSCSYGSLTASPSRGSWPVRSRAPTIRTRTRHSPSGCWRRRRTCPSTSTRCSPSPRGWSHSGRWR
jgi:hypothetical protein